MAKKKSKRTRGSKGKIASAKDLILILLYARGPNGEECAPIDGRTRLMKMVFLFDREVLKQFNNSGTIADNAMPQFKPYDFGPFSAQVYDDLEFLLDMGFVDVTEITSSSLDPVEVREFAHWQDVTGEDGEDSIDWFESKFSLSHLARDFVKDGEAGQLTDKQWEIIENFKKRCVETNLYSLLRYVYSTYPDMAANSRIKEKFLYDDDADIRRNISSESIEIAGDSA